jgi:hypothetical protein
MEPANGLPPSRRVVTVGRLVESLGSTLLDPLEPSIGLDREICGVALVDDVADPQFGAGEVILAAGVATGRMPEFLERVSLAGAAAVVVKWHDPPGLAVRDAAARMGIPVLGLTRTASWLHLAELVRSVLSARDSWGAQVRPTAATGEDLFALAETISAIVDGPVTIEDRQSRVLAFSSRQDEADEGRIQTVLGRQVPSHWLAVLERHGVFRAMSSSRDPVFVTDLPDGARPRVCVAVRAGDELLGSLWAAVDEPLTPAGAAAFRDAANVVALHLLQLRVGQDLGRRLQADLVARVLSGGPLAAEAAGRLRLAAGSLRVIAAQFLDIADDASGESNRQRLRDSLSMQFGALHPKSVTALLDGVVYTVLPVGTDEDGSRAVATTEAMLERLGARNGPVASIGRPVESFRLLPGSRSDADRILGVLRILRASRTEHGGTRVARRSDVRLDSLLIRLSDLLAEDADESADPIATLRAYDVAHQTQLVPSVRAYLDTMGNVQAAAGRLQLHPNTMRYRLRRAVEISGLDLADPDARLEATLMIRMAQLRQG